MGSGGEIKMWLKFEYRSDPIIETDSTQESPSPDMSVSMKFLDAREILKLEVTSLPGHIWVCGIFGKMWLRFQ